MGRRLTSTGRQTDRRTDKNWYSWVHKIPTKWLTSFGSFLVHVVFVVVVLVAVVVVVGVVVAAGAAAACFRLRVACVTTQQKAARIFALCYVARAQLKMGEMLRLQWKCIFHKFHLFAEQPTEKANKARPCYSNNINNYNNAWPLIIQNACANWAKHCSVYEKVFPVVRSVQ